MVEIPILNNLSLIYIRYGFVEACFIFPIIFVGYDPFQKNWFVFSAGNSVCTVFPLLNGYCYCNS